MGSIWETHLSTARRLESCVKKRMRLGAWHLKCFHMLMLTSLYQSGSRIAGCSDQYLEDWWRGRATTFSKSLWSLKKTDWRNIRSRTIMDNFQMSLLWKCHRGALTVCCINMYKDGAGTGRQTQGLLCVTHCSFATSLIKVRSGTEVN